VQRPRANEGGREEEENRPGISAAWAGCTTEKPYNCRDIFEPMALVASAV
jgi:hypothetical protein